MPSVRWLPRAVVFALALMSSLCGVQATFADTLPYHLPVRLPRVVRSPSVSPDAPFTPLVRSLLHQLEPAQPDPETDSYPALGTTVAELTNAAKLLHGTQTSNCTTVGSNDAPTGTNPVISPLCWSDALGINVLTGAQVRQTTAPPLREGMAASWDPRLLNAWGQVEGREGRWLGVTGIYGPQADIMRIPNWGRNLTIFGEDPFQDGILAAAEVNGIQGKGLMSQIKHFAMYNGQISEYDTEVQDQAAHQIYLQPYEYGTSGSGVLPNPGQASSMMCSYQRFEIVPAPGISGGVPSQLAPAGGALSCDNDLKSYVAYHEWRWAGFFASDYDTAMDSTIQAIDSGTDQEMPTEIFFSTPLVAAVEAHAVKLSTFNLALARILYQEQRFHLLGHANGDSNYLSPSNPINSTGRYALTAAQKAEDGAIVERASEEGAVLMKNASHTLPLTRQALRKGVLVLGESAEYMPADVGSEQANGYYDRDAISPLEQLRQFAPKGSHITYLPYLIGSAPTIGDGVTVPRSVLSTNGKMPGTGLERVVGPGAPRVDSEINFTKVSGRGQLAFGHAYSWTGYIDVPRTDDYTFHLQFTVPNVVSPPPSAGDYLGTQVGGPSCTGSGAPEFEFASHAGVGGSLAKETLSRAGVTLGGINTDPTQSGFTERGLASCVYAAGDLTPGMHRVQINWTTPRSLGTDVDNIRAPGVRLPSLRFAYETQNGGLAQVLAAARHAARVVVFADCACATESSITSPNVNQLSSNTTSLIEDVSAVNRHTAIVLNVGQATLMPWLSRVGAVLQTWYPGSEGGTAQARLLLGRADPGGHLTSTWPAHLDDTIFAYNEKTPLYPGDKLGVHPERLSMTPPVDFDEGIYVGYRFFDKEGIRPLFPFGWGLSYTSFRFSRLRLGHRGAGENVTFSVTNTGSVTGDEVPQVYIGPAAHVPTGVQQAVRALAGFDRVILRPHETCRVTIHLGPGREIDGDGDRRAFEYWYTPEQRWVTAPGPRQIWVGSADSLGSLPLHGRS